MRKTFSASLYWSTTLRPDKTKLWGLLSATPLLHEERPRNCTLLSHQSFLQQVPTINWQSWRSSLSVCWLSVCEVTPCPPTVGANFVTHPPTPSPCRHHCIGGRWHRAGSMGVAVVVVGCRCTCSLGFLRLVNRYQCPAMRVCCRSPMLVPFHRSRCNCCIHSNAPTHNHLMYITSPH